MTALQPNSSKAGLILAGLGGRVAAPNYSCFSPLEAEVRPVQLYSQDYGTMVYADTKQCLVHSREEWRMSAYQTSLLIPVEIKGVAVLLIIHGYMCLCMSVLANKEVLPIKEVPRCT